MENKQLKSFRDLLVWQKAVDLATLVYFITEKFARSELYGITNQMRRSAVSISSNIAEGFKRRHGKEKLQFYNIAYGSTAELESQIEVSRRLHFLHEDDYQKLNASVTEIGKMIDGLIKSFNRRSSKSYILNPVFFFIFLTSLAYILNPPLIFAAQLNFVSPTPEVVVGQQFRVDLIIDTENEAVNAVEGKIVFSADQLEVREIRENDSIINFWVEKPSGSVYGNEIPFSGITPGGYLGNKGLILSAIFQTKKEGKGVIEIKDATVLLNDGAGTATGLKIENLGMVIIRAGISGSPWVFPKDADRPEEFKPEIVSDPNIFDGRYFLVFATQDKSSGISRYEVKEFRQRFFSVFSKWTEAESPYVLKDQKMASFLYVKAVDKAGNERIAVIPPRYPIRWYEAWWVWGIIFLGLVVAYLIRKILWRKYRP